jgi:hypothetical protein
MMNDTITAVFSPRIITDSLVINEINYNSAPDFDPGDWVELFNPMDHSVDISNWVFKDELDAHVFTFVQGTSIASKGYLVIAADMTAFHSLFPAVTNYYGPTGFSFAGGGELLRVYNNTGTLVDTVNYDDVAPWPLTPDGQGATLELISPLLDNALGQNWKASTIASHGTPGVENSLNVELEEPEAFQKAVITIYPNPFRNETTLKIKTQSAISDGTVELYNVSGQKVLQMEHITSKEIKINRNGLQPGLYLIRFTDKSSGIAGIGKLMVE